MLSELFEGVWKKDGLLLTQNLAPGKKVYDERLVSIQGIEYRSWNPNKSKLAAAILCGLNNFAFRKDSKVLYLGAATGTTPSHVSDIVREGIIYAIEFSPISMQSLLGLCEQRSNLIPLLNDARMPEKYSDIGKVDVIYQDVAQPDQARILAINSDKFLRPNGIAYLCLKARSVDVSRSNKEIFADTERELKQSFEILERIGIEKFEGDHMFYVLGKV